MTDRRFNKHESQRRSNGMLLYNRARAKDQPLCNILHPLDHRVTHIRTCLEALSTPTRTAMEDTVQMLTAAFFVSSS